MVANLMFDLDAVNISTDARSSSGLWLGEVVATFGLLLVIFGVVRVRSRRRRAVRGRRLHRSCVLVHVVDQLRQPRGHHRPHAQRHLRRHRTVSVPAVHRLPALGGLAAVARPLPVSRSSRDRTRRPPRQLNERAAMTRTRRHRQQNSALRSGRSRLARVRRHFGAEPSSCSSSAATTNSRPGADRTFIPLLAERFARQRLKALAKVEGKADDGIPIVLFLCVHNAGRSQMALGWFNHLAGDRADRMVGRIRTRQRGQPLRRSPRWPKSASTSPTSIPKPWTDEIVRAADVVVTMGCGDACPLFPGKRYEDWELDDPAGQTSKPYDRSATRSSNACARF